MVTTTHFPLATETVRTAEPDYGPRLTVFVGPWLTDGDDRVQLADGTVCYAIDGHAGDPYRVLCTEVVGVDAGDNEVRRFAAGLRPSAGVSAPVHRGGPTLHASPADGTVVGYYDEV